MGKRSVLESGRPKSIASIDAIKPTIPELAREGGVEISVIGRAKRVGAKGIPELGEALTTTTRLPGRYVLWPRQGLHEKH